MSSASLAYDSIAPTKGTAAEPVLKEREVPAGMAQKLERFGIPPLLASLYARRGIKAPMEVLAGYDSLLPGDSLKNCSAMAEKLVECNKNRNRVLIISDYDCDGATACSVLIDAFQASGLNYGYLVPNREIHGYGLTPAIVEEAAALIPKPEYIITVDNGISSTAGVTRANELGIKVLVTDHHLAPAVLPTAEIIVNPNQPGDEFASKHIAGCGVAFYVAKAYQEAMVRHRMEPGFTPEELLPYVAIGTVADVVALDKNNRILVKEGLARLREGKCSEGIKALARASKKIIETLSCQDIGFGLGPRVNAAGRLAWMNTGIQCLTCRDPEQAWTLAVMLDETNEERKRIQETMLYEAERIKDPEVLTGDAYSVVVHDERFHKGVVGIVAGRMKETYYRPTFVMTTTKTGEFVGSGRSIPGFHLKHALDELNIEHPGMLVKFGGHAMAAGVTVAEGRFEEFKTSFEDVCRRHLTPDLLEVRLEHDGTFPAEFLNVAEINALNLQVWGQGFPSPVFVDDIEVTNRRLMGNDKHLKLKGRLGRNSVDVVAFSQAHRYDDIVESVKIAYQPNVNLFNGQESIQLMVSNFPGLPRLTPDFQPEVATSEPVEQKPRRFVMAPRPVIEPTEVPAVAKSGGLLDRLRRAKAESNRTPAPVGSITTGTVPAELLEVAPEVKRSRPRP